MTAQGVGNCCVERLVRDPRVCGNHIPGTNAADDRCRGALYRVAKESEQLGRISEPFPSGTDEGVNHHPYVNVIVPWVRTSLYDAVSL